MASGGSVVHREMLMQKSTRLNRDRKCMDEHADQLLNTGIRWVVACTIVASMNISFASGLVKLLTKRCFEQQEVILEGSVSKNRTNCSVEVIALIEARETFLGAVLDLTLLWTSCLILLNSVVIIGVVVVFSVVVLSLYSNTRNRSLVILVCKCSRLSCSCFPQ